MREVRMMRRTPLLVCAFGLIASLLVCLSGPAAGVEEERARICATWPEAEPNDCWGPSVDVFAGTPLTLWTKDEGSARERVILWATAPGSDRARVIARLRFSNAGKVRYTWHAPDEPDSRPWVFWFRQPDGAPAPILHTGKLRAYVYFD